VNYDLVLDAIVFGVSVGLVILYVLLYYYSIELPKDFIYLELASVWAAIGLIYLKQLKRALRNKK